MSIRYLFPFVLSVIQILTHSREVTAQPVTKMTFQKYDTLSKGWSEAHEIHWIYKNSDGIIDSVLRLKTLSATMSTMERFYDWVHVTDEIDLTQLDGFDRSLVQPGYKGMVARNKKYFAIEARDTLYVEKKEIGVVDSFVHTHAETVFGSDGFFAIDSFFRDEMSQVYKKRRLVRGAHYSEDRTILKQITRDSLDRVIQSVDKEHVIGESTYDSILYEYAPDNTLRTVYQFNLNTTSYINKIEYGSWTKFVDRVSPFARGSIVGGSGYDTVTSYWWDADSTRFVYSGSARKQFDPDGMGVVTHYVLRTMLDSVMTDVFGFDTTTFYPNGDPNTNSGWNSRVSRLYVSKYFNTYSGSGNLLASEYISDGAPLTRITFEYFTSKVKELLDSGPSSSIGRLLILSAGKQNNVKVHNILGVNVLSEMTNESQFSLPLPSGLYFISINGGKPRKHLIP